MNQPDVSVEQLLSSLKERAKELNCLYQVEEILADNETPLEELFMRVIEALPSGWHYPEICQARIIYNKEVFQTEGYEESEWVQKADIMIQKTKIGSVEISYKREMPKLENGPFVKEEQKLISTVADRISQTILHRQLEPLFKEQAKAKAGDKGRPDWRIVLDMLEVTDQALSLRISRRMLNYLCYNGVEEARALLESAGGGFDLLEEETRQNGDNRPIKRRTIDKRKHLSEEVFKLAETHLNDEIIFTYIQKWIKENKFSFLVNVLDDHRATLSEITDAIVRFKFADISEEELPVSTTNAIKVSLIRRFFSRRLEVINIAKKCGFTIEDFYDFTRRLIFPSRSDGKLGGKSAGLFIASKIIQNNSEKYPELKEIKVPKTWFITSDGIMDFINYNHLEELIEHKYRDIEQVRIEYPNIVQLFKNSSFSPEMVKGLALALDDFEERPLIVRSSSLLEDSIGAAFSGKYKSLFIANQGSKEDRLAALLDAIAEIYASMFGPDPIEYRAERGLLDYQEEMGVMIQEVVGKRVRKYLMPAFAGVAFSNNEFRWSPRIKREDGLIRLVPGLGTRAVDRLSDDFPVLVSPGQPNLRVNATPEEVLRYAPKYADVINLETNSFETIEIDALIKECGHKLPAFNKIFSVSKAGIFQKPSGLVDYEEDKFVAAFDELIKNTDFVKRIKSMLDVLQEHYKTPIDMEFASDGEDFFLLQCRPQSSGDGNGAAVIPSDIDPSRIVFSANKYVSNGFVPDITHIVYVTPDGYDNLSSLAELKAVGRAVGRLNKILPKRQFILIGPGRWGSRGDVKLGVSVGYSEINNTAALIEVAFKKGAYLPDLSFGTHFFQDLVEAEIRYLPLYPDEPKAVFNEDFLRNSKNILPDILPEYANLASVVKVIDVQSVTDRLVLRLLMNADENRALAYLVSPAETITKTRSEKRGVEETDYKAPEEHWKWRMHMAEVISQSIDPKTYGVRAMYVFGSVKNATAGPYSDIDLIVHFAGKPNQLNSLKNWLEGWSLCLSEMVYLKTGYKPPGLLDVHIVTDEDIANKTSFAVKIGAVSDAARPLPMANN